MRSKAETTARILTVMIGCVLALAIGMWVSGDVGAMRDKVEKDARGGVVPDGFVCQSSEGNRMQALVFYDPNDPDNGAKAMVYVDRTGLYGDGLDRKFAFGWFFRGSTPNAVPGTVEGLMVEGYAGVAYFSGTGVARIEMADGTGMEHDPALPLAWVGGENTRFYGADGSELPCAVRPF